MCNTNINKKKREEVILSPVTTSPITTDNSKKGRDNTKTPLKYSITERLRTAIERSA